MRCDGRPTVEGEHFTANAQNVLHDHTDVCLFVDHFLFVEHIFLLVLTLLASTIVIQAAFHEGTNGRVPQNLFAKPQDTAQATCQRLLDDVFS